MANVFQAASGYRDPMKAMTLKALEARAKAAAEASASAMAPTQITSPMQGAAGILDVVGARMNEGRVDAAEASGRQELANTMAGINMDTGPDMATIARVSMRDPELAQHLYDQAMERKAKADEMKFQSGEHALDRDQRAALQKEAEGATASEGSLQRTSQEGIAGANRTSAEGINANTQTQENARTGLTLSSNQKIETQREDAASKLETQRSDAASKLETQKSDTAMKQGTEELSKIMAQYNAGGYGPVGSPEAMKMRDDGIKAANLKGTPPAAPEDRYAGGAADEAVKRHSKIIAAGNASVPFTAKIHQLVELGKNLDTSPKDAMIQSLAPFAQGLGINIDNQDQYQAFKSIAESLAPGMRIEGAGSSSDTDVRMFLNSLPSISKLPGANAIIEGTLLAAEQNKQAARDIAMRANLPPDDPNYLKWFQVDQKIAELPDPFMVGNAKIAELQKGIAGGGVEDPNDPLGRRTRKGAQ